MAEGAALEMLYTLIAYRGFESLPLLQKRKHTERCVFFFLYDRRDSKEKSPLPAAEEGLLSGVLTESLPLLQKKKTYRKVCFLFYTFRQTL